MLKKYIKCNIWRGAVRSSYIWDARFLKVNILGGSVHNVKENAKALIMASKEIGLEVNPDKTSTWSCLEIRMQD